MRKILNAGLILVILILLAGASVWLSARPKPKPKRPAPQIAFSEEYFREPLAHRTNDITLALGQKLTVDLGSNITTGWAWQFDTPNSDPTVLKQVGHEYISDEPPAPGWVGHGGIQTWTFETLKAGSATLQFTYAHGDTNVLEQRRLLKLTVNVQ